VAITKTRLALPALVALSSLLEWLAARRISGLWIMPDEAIYGQRALAFWRTGRLSVISGAGAGYSLLYPILAGAPLSIGTPASGYAALKVVQAIVVSLTAVPVFLYARRVMADRWALVAAALSLASPIVLYAGFVMTEVLFYPLAAWALLAIARAVATESRRDQAIALALIAACVLTRTQGVVLIAVFALAVLIARRSLRSFAVLWAVVAAGLVIALVLPEGLGAYGPTLRARYPLGLAAGLTWDHFAFLVLSTGVVPVAALAVLQIRGMPDVEGRSLVATATAAVLLVVAQVGIFASGYAPHLLGRDLAALPPILFVVFALWLSRDGSRRLALVVAAGTLAALAATPWSHLIVLEARPDSFGIVIFEHAHVTLVVVAAAAVLLALFVLAPRALPVVVLAGLVASTAVASDRLASVVREEQVDLVGADHRWIDHAARGPVAELYDGESYWNGVWQATFWNRRVREIVALAPTRVPGPIEQRQERVGAGGRIDLRSPYVVASDPHTFIGTPVAHLAQNGLDVTGLTLWRLDPPARLSTVTHGILPNGDMTEPGRLTVYDCAGGQLQLTLLPKSTRVVTVLLDGRVASRATIGGLEYWNGTVSVPRSPTPRVCHFTIQGQTLLGSTRVAFVRSRT
jgi:Dolichyl-phosphate-mannose-protein mannosyltransferase